MGDWKNMQKFRILLISILILISLGVLFFLADKEIRNKEESGFTYQISRLIPESVKDFLKETLFAKSALESKIEVLEKEKLLTAQENITLYTSYIVKYILVAFTLFKFQINYFKSFIGKDKLFRLTNLFLPILLICFLYFLYFNEIEYSIAISNYPLVIIILCLGILIYQK